MVSARYILSIQSGFLRAEWLVRSWTLPVKWRLLSTVKGILELLNEVSLAWQPEKTLFFQPPLSDKVHTLFHQHWGQTIPISLLITDSVLQLLSKNAWRNKGSQWIWGISITPPGYFKKKKKTLNIKGKQRQKGWQAFYDGDFTFLQNQIHTTQLFEGKGFALCCPSPRILHI